MNLTKLQIEMPNYGPNKGRYVGRVHFDNNFNASVEIPLDDELSRKILQICADEVTKAGKEVAALMVQDVIDSVNLLEVDSA